MTLTRDELREEIVGSMIDVMDLADLTETDDVQNMGGILNRTLRGLGYTQAALPTAVIVDGDEAKAIALGEYWTIYRAILATVSSMNVSAGQAKADLHQQYENLKDRLAHARAIVEGYGISVDVDSAGGGAYHIWAGGMSQSDYDTIASDGDRVAPMFTMDDLLVPGGMALNRLGVWGWE